VAYHVQAVEATRGANQTTRMSYSYRGFRIAPSRFGLEHPRPYAVCRHRLPGPSARKPQSIDKVIAALEKHPWYVNQWEAGFQNLPLTGRWATIFAEMTSKHRRSVSHRQTAISCLSHVRNCSSRNRNVSKSMIPASRNRCELVFMPFIEVRGPASSNPGPM
jgi:hypothetical protein